MIEPTGLPLSLTATSKQATPQKTKDVGTQFEAMLIAQMLSSARESETSGWGGESNDKSGDTMMEMAEQQLSQILASNGGLGLAKVVVRGLSKPATEPSEKP